MLWRNQSHVGKGLFYAVHSERSPFSYGAGCIEYGLEMRDNGRVGGRKKMVTWAVCWLARLTIRHWTAATKGNGLRSTLQPLPLILLPIILFHRMDACSTVEARKCRKEGWRRGESKIDCVFGHLAAARIETRIKWSSCCPAAWDESGFFPTQIWSLTAWRKIWTWGQVQRRFTSRKGKQRRLLYLIRYTSDIIFTDFHGNVYFTRLLYLNSSSKGCTYISSCRSDITHLRVHRLSHIILKYYSSFKKYTSELLHN